MHEYAIEKYAKICKYAKSMHKICIKYAKICKKYAIEKYA